jgi:putative flippase GtrA
MTEANHTAASATLHCLTGCAIGEVLGMVVSTAFSWPTFPSIVISVALAFLFGYTLSMRPLLKHSLGIGRALRIAFAADTASIATMELADNAFILMVPGAIHAGLDTILFWLSLSASLAVAYVVAFPLNRYLIARGKGHAIAHEYHHG